MLYLIVVAAEVVDELRSKYRAAVAVCTDHLVLLPGDIGLVGDIQAGHDDRNARIEHDLGSLGVSEDIELSRSGPVAHIEAAAHDGELLDLLLEIGADSQQDADVGHRAGG